MSDEPQTIEVDLPGGVKVPLPKEVAEKVIAGRQLTKTQLDEANRKLGAMEATTRAAEEARTKAETEKAHAEAVKAGDIAKATEIATKADREKLAKLADRYRDTTLESRIKSMEGVVPEAVGDIAAQLRQSCRFNLDTDTLEIMDAAGKPIQGDDGKPIGVDAHIAKFLEARPYFRRATQAPGSGAGGQGGKSNGPTMTQAAFENLSPIEGGKFFKDGGKIVG